MNSWITPGFFSPVLTILGQPELLCKFNLPTK